MTKGVKTEEGRRRKVMKWVELFQHYMLIKGGGRPRPGKDEARVNDTAILAKQFNNYLWEHGLEEHSITVPQIRRLLKV